MSKTFYSEFVQASEAAKRLAKATSNQVLVEPQPNGYAITEVSTAKSDRPARPASTTSESISSSRYKLGEDEWSAAIRRAEELPVYENSHRERDANIVGSLGEVVAEKWFRENRLGFNDERGATTHDYKVAESSLVDVKTKDRTVPPLPDYDCSVPLYNHEHQRPHYYVFVSLQRSKKDDSSARSFKFAYVLGIADQ